MLQICQLYKAYANQPILRHIDLTITAGEIVCLLGPSGCGKTTLLRIVSGLEEADQGAVTVAGRDLRQTPVHQRNFGLMFQDFALFPHRTVGENIAFGLRMQRQSPAQIADRVAEMLALVNLTGYAARSIFALSGGERQRVALARSLAPQPRLLMLDEPLGSLDRALREELMNDLRAILKQVGVTAIYVTHDQQEALAVADRIVVMQAGQIEQVGTPQQLYLQPANSFVARFLGLENLLPAMLLPGQPSMVETPIGGFILPSVSSRPAGAYTLLIRPQAAGQIEPGHGEQPTANVIQGVLTLCSFRGSYYRIGVQVGEGAKAHLLSFELPTWKTVDPAQLSLRPGAAVQVRLDPALLSLLESP